MLSLQAPSWHGYFVLKSPPKCRYCEAILSTVEHIAHRAYQDHELRMCAHFTVLMPEPEEEVPDVNQLFNSALQPMMFWIPPMHEQHEMHARPTVWQLSSADYWEE
jgi:hypothetical protein